MFYKLTRKTFCDHNLVKEFKNQDYYSILKVKPTSTENEIRKNYYSLAKKYHPDKFKGPVEIFRKITEAYNTLKDHSKRELYNTKLKIKIRKDASKDMGSVYEEERKTSLYEEDFKKLDIEKLFFQFEKKKFRLKADEIKIFKPVLEKKMSKREFVINEFFKRLSEKEAKEKSLKYFFYKKTGKVKEDEEITKTYDELVNEEMQKIKNKQTFREEIKKEKEEAEKKEDEQEAVYKKIPYVLAVFYCGAMGYIVLLHYLRENKKKEILKKNLEIKHQQRLKDYQYLA
jgi:curved DNA-binding protein